MNNRIFVLISFLVGLILFSGNCFADSECFEENGVIYCNDVTSYTDTNGNVFTGIGTITISSGDKSITMLDRNLGATTNDISKTGSYGYYFQWGTGSSINTGYKGDWDNLCPEGYKIPTSGDLSKLNSIILGSSNCKNGSNTGKCVSNLLHIPFASSYTDTGKFLNDMAGRYRTSTFNSKKDSFYWSIITSEIRLNNKIASNNLGFSIRCFANEPHQFVTLSFSGTNSEIQNQLLISGTKAQSPDEPEMSGSQFSGWYLTGMETKWDFETDVVTGNITLYAKWIDENEEENESENINIETEQSGNCVRLPEGYQEVEYIESHGQEYIDLGIIANSITRFKIKAQANSYNDIYNKQLLGTNKELESFFGRRKKDGKYTRYGTNHKLTGNELGVADYIYNGSGIIGNVNGYSGSETIVFSDSNLLLLGGSRNRIVPNAFVYYIQIWNNSDLVFHGVPCITSGDEYGLYDLVSKKFFGNSGEGAFSGGNIVQTDLCESDNPIEDSKGTYTVKFIYVDEEPIKLLSGDIVGEKTFNKGEIIQFPDENSIAPYPTSGYVFSGWIEKKQEENRVKKAPAKMAKGGSQEPLETNLQSSKVLTTQNDNSNDDIIVSSDMTFIAQFKEAESTGTTEEINSGDNQIINTGSKRKKKSTTTVENNETNTHNASIVYDDTLSQELNDAYKFAYENRITTMDSIGKANMLGGMDRISMAKMLSQYAINILGKEPADIEVPNFTDISEDLDAQYLSGVTLAYQLGIMGINMPNNEFRPFDLVPRAEFGTALSRMLYKLADGNDIYYSTHLNKLKSEGILKDINPSLLELRGWGMLMLMRSSSK